MWPRSRASWSYSSLFRLCTIRSLPAVGSALKQEAFADKFVLTRTIEIIALLCDRWSMNESGHCLPNRLS